MAEVFLAAVAGPAGFNKLLVVKLMKPELLEEPEHKAMFLDEGKIAARLNHPNIVQTHEVQIEGEQYFMAMEYLDGQPLHRILRRAHKTQTYLPLHWHLHFLCEVLAGLEYAHTLADYDGRPLKLVHRDVTPHNVFVTYTGQVKLCDFGIAKSLVSSVETRAGILRGKVAYMAPEQVLGAKLDHRADLFSVGVMLWEAVAGARIWDGYAEIQIMQALSQGEIPRLRDVDPKVDPELEAIAARALAVRPEERYSSAQEFRRAVEGFLFSHTARVDPHALGDWVGKQFEKERAGLQQVIQEQLTGPHQAPTALDSLPPVGAQSAGSSPSHSARGQYFGSVPSAPGTSGGNMQLGGSRTIPSVEVQAPRQRRTFAAAIGVAAALFVFLVIAATVLVVRTARSPEAQVSDVEPVKAPGGGDTSTPTAQGSATAVTEVRIRISVVPATAKLSVDGKEIKDRPYVVALPATATDHAVRVEAPGHETENRIVKFDRSQELTIELKKSPGTGAKGPFVAPRAPDEPEIKIKKKPPTTQLDPDDPWK